MPGLGSSPVAVQAPVAGSYTSAVDERTTSTVPSCSSVAVMLSNRGFPVARKFAVAVHDPVTGSYSSAESVARSGGTSPPATSTPPSGSSVAVWL